MSDQCYYLLYIYLPSWIIIDCKVSKNQQKVFFILTNIGFSNKTFNSHKTTLNNYWSNWIILKNMARIYLRKDISVSQFLFITLFILQVIKKTDILVISLEYRSLYAFYCYLYILILSSDSLVILYFWYLEIYLFEIKTSPALIAA